jgi:hypothetical protein
LRNVVEAAYTSLRLNGNFLRQVGVVFQEHNRRHHLGNAGDRTLVLGIFLPENLTVRGVENDGGGGANIGNEFAACISLVPRRHRLVQSAHARDFARTGGGAGSCQTSFAGL